MIGAQIINGGQQYADLHNLKYNKSIIFTTVRDNTGRKKVWDDVHVSSWTVGKEIHEH